MKVKYDFKGESVVDHLSSGRTGSPPMVGPIRMHPRGKDSISWKAKRLDVKIRMVCKRCNTGWMAKEVERPTQTLLTMPILGLETLLEPAEQILISRWASKTAALLAYTPGVVRHPSPDVMRWLMDHAEPPFGSGVWLAHYGGPGQSFFNLHHRGLNPNEMFPGGPEDAVLATIVIGSLAIFVGQVGPVKSLPPGTQLGFAWRDGISADYILQIWPQPDPPIELHWPPRGTLLYAEAVYMAEAFKNDLARVVVP